MNPIKLLKEDHRTVLNLIKEIEQTSDTAVKTREKLFTKLFELIKKHEKMEEKVLYPAAEDKPEMHDLVKEAYEEHHVVDNILKEATKIAADSDDWKAKITVMRENLEHHIKEEEEALFPKVEQSFDKQSLEEFGDKMVKIKQQDE